jgi:hypothetical protein
MALRFSLYEERRAKLYSISLENMMTIGDLIQHFKTQKSSNPNQAQIKWQTE